MKRDVTAMVNKNSSTKDKASRAQAFRVQASQGKVFIPKGAERSYHGFIYKHKSGKKHREAEFDKSQFKTRIDLKL